MIQVGMLNLKETNQLFFCPIGESETRRTPILLEAGAEFEVNLGGVWIPGQLRIGYGAAFEIEYLLFVASDGTFCGLASGMKARLLNSPKVERE